MIKEETFLRKAVEGGSLHDRVSVRAGMRPAPVVRNGEQNIRLFREGGRGK